MNLFETLGSISMSVFPPVLTVFATVFLPVAIGAVFKWLERNGLDIEASHRDALQSALHNAAMVAIERATGKKTTSTQPTPVDYIGSAIEIIPNVSAGIEYVKNSVPDAVNKFRLDTGRIKDLLEPHIVEAAKRAGVTTKGN